MDAPLIEQVVIHAPEDWPLAGTLFIHPNPSPEAPVILMSSAAGVPHGYYTNFATHLVHQGTAAVLAYDYRGMGNSAGDRIRWKNLRMFHWARFDFPAAAEFLKTRYPDRKLVGMGHSYGGQALGLSGIASMFERFGTVATMSGYWRHLETPFSVWFQTQIIGRPVANLLGHVPKAISPGDGFPGPIFTDWANWINSPNYWFDHADVPGLEEFEKVSLPYLSCRVADDNWGTAKAIGTFMRRYKRADMRHTVVTPGETGKIGHLGYFRQKHKEAHWGEMSAFLLEGIFPDDAVKQAIGKPDYS